jgi:membrane protein implicated in regulation of membrane protease activity
VNYRGADWDARGQAEIAAGTFAKIVGRDGNTLIIEQETN